MTLYDIAKSSFGCVISALSFFTVRKVLHFQHKNLELSTSVHDEHCGQTADANGDRVNDISGQSLHKLHDLEGRTILWVKQASVDRERMQSHRLIVDDISSL